MDKVVYNCPLCCKESFDSPEALKSHISTILNKEVKCPICMKNVGTYNNFIQHLKDCVSVETSAEKYNKLVTKIKPNDEMKEEISVSEENQEQNEYYCEICDIHFSEMKKHLMENHMGQQVVVEGQQSLDEIMEESNTMDDDELNHEGLDNAPSPEQIILEEEILDEEGEFFTKKRTKIDIVSENPQKLPIIEQVIFGEIPNVENPMKVFRCPKCNKRFLQLRGYNRHECDSKKGAVCDICSIYTPSRFSLSQHKKKYHAEELIEAIYECDVCKIKFGKEKSMLLHKRVHAPKIIQKSMDTLKTYNVNGTQVSKGITETFTCTVCGKEYNKKYEEDHMKSHKEHTLLCSICNKEFLNRNDLSLHLQAHGNDVNKKMSCSLCKKDFLKKEALEDHIKNICEEKKYSCSFCGKRFTKAHEMVKHERIHTGVKPYTCEICGKNFRVSYCLTLHMRTHSGVRPYECKTCGKRFKSHGSYSHHINIHSDVRSYQCPYCPKAFKTAVQLAGHRNSHTKPFSCNICNRPFASLYAVRMHAKCHEREVGPLHKCHICGAEYMRQTALQDHLSTHHESENQDLSSEQSEDRMQMETSDMEEGEIKAYRISK